MNARAVAPCADVIRPPLRPLPDIQRQEWRALLSRRQSLTTKAVALLLRRSGYRRCLKCSLRLQQKGGNLGCITEHVPRRTGREGNTASLKGWDERHAYSLHIIRAKGL